LGHEKTAFFKAAQSVEKGGLSERTKPPFVTKGNCSGVFV
jgi:hypothetical protein